MVPNTKSVWLLCLSLFCYICLNFNLISFFLFQVTATDADGGSFGSISYSLGSGPGTVTPSQFNIGKHNGQICTTTSLDRDQGPANYDFTVTAVDGVSVSAATSLTNTIVTSTVIGLFSEMSILEASEKK